MKKGIVLVTVMGIVLVVFSLAFAAIFLMTQESQVAERKIRHMRASYAAKAGMVDALEQLRRGAIALPVAGNPTSYNLAGIGAGIAGYPLGGLTANIQVVIRGDVANGCPVAGTSNYCVNVAVTH